MAKGVRITNIEELLSEEIDLINKTIERFVPRRIDEELFSQLYGKPKYKIDLDSLNEAVYKPVWDMLDRGGKRWRSSLFLLVYEALGGKENKEEIAKFAIIPEVVHNGTLIIDDIEDRSELRRGKPATYKIFGEDIAINAGDIMYCLPLVVLLKNKNDMDEKILNRLYEIYIKEMMNVSFGQAIDIAWHNSLKEEIEEGEYMQMCFYKTGSLARMSVKMAAALARSKEEVIETLGDFGGTMGVAFQIQDDILNIAGKEFQKRKGYGDDITEGKRSLLVIHTLEKADEKDRERLLDILDSHTKDLNKIEEAIGIIKKYRSIEYAKKVAKDLIKESWNNAEQFLREGKAKKKIKALIDFFVEREI